MIIKEIKVMRGPNYWSVRRPKLIQMLLDLGPLEQQPTNTIAGFAERLQAALPSMQTHRCSEGVAGGFFSRVAEGTWMGHVVEHIALELQTLAGMDCGFGRTRGAGEEGVYHVVFDYMEEEAGVYAAKAAVELAEALISDTPFDMAKAVQNLRELREAVRMGPSTGCIVEEAAKRGIPFIRLNKHSLVQLGYGVHQKRIRATIASTTSNIAVDIACDKNETKNLLSAAQVPVPMGVVIRSEEELEGALSKVGYPLVIKPIDGNHGKGNTTNITTLQQAQKAFEGAKLYGRNIIVEKYITGYDFRVLVINYKFVCAALRTPAAVVGDGVQTIAQLIEKVNADPRRGYGHEKVLTQITIDQYTEKILAEKGYDLNTVPAAGEQVLVKPTANLSTGGTSTDVTEEVHPDNIILCERIARIVGLDICGIDIMATDLKTPLELSGGAVLEVNAAPGFRMHIEPAEGLARNVAEPVIDMLFPNRHNGRIPIVAVTGTNGKTTTTRLIAHITKAAGRKVGYTTSDGVYIQNQMLMKGDCTGPVSAQFVLKDPTVDFAVLECARGGLLRSGLPFAHCDVGIVTNVSADHMGLGGIDTMEKMARVKAVIPETVFRHGYAILNADDDLVYKMRTDLDCNVALFSMDENNERIQRHCKKGGYAAVFENDYITILKGTWKIRVMPVREIPITYGGKALHNVMNTLPAVLAAWLFKDVTIEDIRSGLGSFIPSSTQTPGRLNMFEFNRFKVLADFAHNPAGVGLLGEFVSKLDATRKIGIISGTGDRRDEDIREMGRLSGKYFDEIIIRADKHLRGRTAQNIVDLLTEGIAQNNNPHLPVKVILKESEAIEYACKHAEPGALITILCDVITDALAQLKRMKEAEEKEMQAS